MPFAAHTARTPVLAVALARMLMVRRYHHRCPCHPALQVVSMIVVVQVDHPCRRIERKLPHTAACRAIARCVPRVRRAEQRVAALADARAYVCWRCFSSFRSWAQRTLTQTRPSKTLSSTQRQHDTVLAYAVLGAAAVNYTGSSSQTLAPADLASAACLRGVGQTLALLERKPWLRQDSRQRRVAIPKFASAFPPK